MIKNGLKRAARCALVIVMIAALAAAWVPVPARAIAPGFVPVLIGIEDALPALAAFVGVCATAAGLASDEFKAFANDVKVKLSDAGALVGDAIRAWWSGDTQQVYWTDDVLSVVNNTLWDSKLISDAHRLVDGVANADTFATALAQCSAAGLPYAIGHEYDRKGNDLGLRILRQSLGCRNPINANVYEPFGGGWRWIGANPSKYLEVFGASGSHWATSNGFLSFVGHFHVINSVTDRVYTDVTGLSVGKVTTAGSDVGLSVVDPSITQPGTIPGSVTGTGSDVIAYPGNPSWAPGQDQTEAQRPHIYVHPTEIPGYREDVIVEPEPTIGPTDPGGEVIPGDTTDNPGVLEALLRRLMQPLVDTFKPLFDTVVGGIKSLAGAIWQPIVSAVEAVGEFVISGVKSIFVPSEDFVTAKVDALRAKFGFFESIYSTGSQMAEKLHGLSGGPPKIWVDLGAATNGRYYGDKMLFMDLSWYEPYKERADIILGGFLWACFFWRMFKRLPSLISGAGDDVQFLDSIAGQDSSGVEDRKGAATHSRSKRRRKG